MVNVRDKAIDFLENLLDGLKEEDSVVATFEESTKDVLATKLDGSKHSNGVKILNLKLRYRINKD